MGGIYVVLLFAAASVAVWRFVLAPPPLSNGERAALGRRVDSLYLIGRNDDFEAIVLRGRPTLLYLFLPGCVPCDMQKGVWRDLAKEFGHRIRVVPIASRPDPLDSSYLGLDIGEYRAPTLGVLERTFGTSKTPTTIVIDSSGIILLARIGLMVPGERRHVRSTLRKLLSPD